MEMWKQRARRAADPAAARREGNRNYLKKTLRKFGLTPEDYHRMHAAQEGKCEICGVVLARLFVDHCHVTGRLRGLLCRHCNAGLGFVRENVDILRSMIRYIEKHK